MKHWIQKFNHLLAAEYVLGTMRGAARKRYQTYLQRYPELAEAVNQWQGEFGALVDTIPGQTPPPELWEKIKSKL